MRRVFLIALGAAAFLTGCASRKESGLVCSGSVLRYEERTQLKIYLVPDPIHGNSRAVAELCPDDILLPEARMATADERHAFWNRFTSLEPGRGLVPAGHATVVGKIRRADGDGFAVLEIYETAEVEAAFPPPQIAETLHLDLPVNAQ